MLTKEQINQYIEKSDARKYLTQGTHGEDYKLYKDAYQRFELAFKEGYNVYINDGAIRLVEFYTEGSYIISAKMPEIVFDCHFAPDEGLTKFISFVLNTSLKDALTRKQSGR